MTIQEDRIDRLKDATVRWGVTGIDLAQLNQAFVHTSAVAPHSTASNERLEFLGDSIVNASAAERLYLDYPNRSEGELAKGRALVVCKLSLYQAGVRLGIPDLLQVGSNAEGTMARGRRSIVADAFEALVAVIYLNFGWEQAKQFVLAALEPELAQVELRHDLRDAKTILQELAQARHENPPVYRIIAESGEAHSMTFTAEVHVHNGITASGSGRSKKDAHQAAAQALLDQLIEDSGKS